MKTLRDFLNEDAGANAVGGGAIAGVGVGSDGEPGVKHGNSGKKENKNKKRRLIGFEYIGAKK